jgi:hypothetical protein
VNTDMIPWRLHLYIKMIRIGCNTQLAYSDIFGYSQLEV